MRILGLALVLLGYSWLVWDQFSFGPIARVAMERSLTTDVLIRRSAHPVPLASLPDTAYSLRNDLAKGLPPVGVRELDRLLPNFLWSGTTMLVGGLILARESSARKGGRRAFLRVLAGLLALLLLGFSSLWLIGRGPIGGWIVGGLTLGALFAVYAVTGWAPGTYGQEVFRRGRPESEGSGSEQ